MSSRFQIGPEVEAALSAGLPVLALESTIMTHGMPWPVNLETVRQAEQVIREANVLPATIAIVDGVARVGLEDHELERLARSGAELAKCSRRDLSSLLTAGATAGTTVAATMMLAHRAGIRVFATGGIGGVHRDAAMTFDVSADLLELARTPVAVVCAGPKAILDIGLTREYLETLGVPVIGFRTDDLPAFYCRRSGFPVDYRLDSVAEIAELMGVHDDLSLEQGMVIANPIARAHALDETELEELLSAALGQATDARVVGKELTPFLLQKIEEMTGGASLDANVALMLSNARLGAEISAALCSAN